MEDLKGYKFRKVEIKKDFEAEAFFTKLARRQRDLNLLTSPADITKANMEIFVNWREKKLGRRLMGFA